MTRRYGPARPGTRGDPGHEDPGDRVPSAFEISRLAAHVLGAIPFPALVLEVPSERIVASSPAAARLLDPDGATVDGHLLRDFTTDRPASGQEVTAGARLDGAETPRVLRRSGSEDVHIRLWIRSFDHQPTSTFVVAVFVADGDPGSERLDPSDDGTEPGADSPDAPAVVGLVDASLLIERISSDAEALFGVPVSALLHTSLLSIIDQDDVARCLLALGESSASRNGVSLNVHMVTGAGSPPIRCELLLRPLQPAPRCAFVLMPISETEAGSNDPDNISVMLLRLRRGAEISRLDHGAFLGASERARPGLDRLTTREFEVVTRLLDGQRPPAIARALFLSQSTVRNHLGSVYAKLGVTSQQQLLNLLRSA